MSASMPGNTKEESITMFLDALRNSSNRQIFPQIEKALKQLGLTERQIEYYKMTGTRMKEWDDFEDEMDEMDTMFDRQFGTFEEKVRKIKGRSSFISLVLGVAVVFVVGILMSILIFSGADDSKSSAKTPPAITESAPVSDGDKL